jgi:hypothetical protein
MYAFPFGQPHQPTPPRRPEGNAELFVVGVYPSALHAAWYSPSGKRLCQALAVDIEPWSFWDGADADERINAIAVTVPAEAGALKPADPKWNGPSGRALQELYLGPLGKPTAWLTDLHEGYYLSDGNAKAIAEHYMPMAAELGLPAASLPTRPAQVQPSPERLSALEEEFVTSGAQCVLTLGNEPLPHLFPNDNYKLQLDGYGRPARCMLFGRHEVTVLRLCHPRQAAALGRSSSAWRSTHAAWVDEVEQLGGLAALVGA